MNARLEQPKHLNLTFAKLSRLPRKMLLKLYGYMGVLYGAFALLAIWVKSLSGESFPWYRWVLAALAGLMGAALVHGLSYLEGKCPRFLELKGRRIQLGWSGHSFALKRFRGLTVTPELLVPDCYRVIVIYKVWLDPKLHRWSMLVDDPAKAAAFERVIREQAAPSECAVSG